MDLNHTILALLILTIFLLLVLGTIVRLLHRRTCTKSPLQEFSTLSMGARQAVSKFAWRTPVLHLPYFSEKLGCQLSAKMENLQHTGSFKIRYPAYAFSKTKFEKVVVASTGNHAIGVAHVARAFGTPTIAVVPANISARKLQTLQRATSRVHRVDGDYEACVEIARTYDGWSYLGAHDSYDHIVANASLFYELFEDLEHPVDMLLVSIGGGSLAAAAALVSQIMCPSVELIGVQCTRYSRVYDIFHGVRRKEREDDDSTAKTVADGIAVNDPWETNVDIIRQYFSDVWLADEAQIRATMGECLAHEHIVVEGAAAVVISAAARHADRLLGKRVACVMCGGNRSDGVE